MTSPPIKRLGAAREDRWSRLLDGSVAVFAVWTVYCHLLVACAGSFDLLLAMSWAPLVVSVALIRFLPRLDSLRLARAAPAGGATPRGLPRGIWLAGAVLVVTIHAAGAPYAAFWVVAVGFLIALTQLGVSPAAPHEAGSTELPARWSNAIVGLLIFVAVGITLVSHRPDIDDAFYLDLVVSAMDHADQPLLRFDGMHGEAGLPLLAHFYRSGSYELLVAVVASITPLSAFGAYYLALPAALAALVIVACWLALRELSGPAAPIGLAVTLLVLIAWGDTHRAYGNFAFVRLFQGKAALVSFCVPALVCYAARFARRRDASSWCGLASTQIAALGFSSSGLVVAPVASALVLLGAWRPNRGDTKMLLLGLAASIYLLGAAVVLFQGTEDPSRLATATRQLSTAQGLEQVLGTGGRAELALFALLAAPILATTAARHRLLGGIALTTVVLALNPLTSSLIGRVVSNMSWRIDWSVPFPLWLGLAGSGFAVYAASLRSWRLGVVVGAVWAATFVAVPGAWTVSAANGTRLGLPAFKVAAGHATARAVVEATPPGGSVLAPWDVSVWIPTFRGHPAVAAVRPHYLTIIDRARGAAEARARHALVSFVSGAELTERQTAAILSTIESRRFTTVVFPADLPSGPRVARRLSALGYEPRTYGDHEIWVR